MIQFIQEFDPSFTQGGGDRSLLSRGKRRAWSSEGGDDLGPEPDQELRPVDRPMGLRGQAVGTLPRPRHYDQLPDEEGRGLPRDDTIFPRNVTLFKLLL